MSLFVANCTKQNWMLNVRIPETGRLAIIEIPSGQQRDIGKGLSDAGVSQVIAHLERFGVRNNADSKLRPDDFDGYLYSLDKPVKSDKISNAHDVLVDKQERRSATEATRSALAFDNATRDKKSGKRLASVSEVEVVQDVPAREKPTGKEVKMKVTVDPGGSSTAKLPV